MTGRSVSVGVLGGMGPAATLDFLQKLLAATPARTDQDHLRVLVDSNPKLPDRNAAIAGRGPSPGPGLASMARGLEASGADVLVMACNTAHAFEPDIRGAVKIPFLSMIEATVEAVLQRSPGVRRVGLLAAAGCLDAGLYQAAFAAHGVRTLEPRDALRERFMALVYRIKAGETGPAARAEMASIGAALVAQGAEALAAACTEVPLVLDPSDVSVPLTDSTDALVAKTSAFARGTQNDQPMEATTVAFAPGASAST